MGGNIAKWLLKCPKCENELSERDGIYYCPKMSCDNRGGITADELARWWQDIAERMAKEHWESFEKVGIRAETRANRARILFRRLREAKFNVKGWKIRYDLAQKHLEEAIQRRDEARRERDIAQGEANDWQIRYNERVRLHEALQKALIESENSDEYQMS